jgi:hypothetical protein
LYRTGSLLNFERENQTPPAMKKTTFSLLLILFAAISLQAQNVGIGDPAPSAKLTIRGSETTLNGEAATIKLQNTASTNAWFLRTGATGTTTPANGFSIADNSGYHFNISAGGNTGIGINPATAKLHVNGLMKIEGSNSLEFGAGIAGKEMNAGKIGYNSFGSGALEIVGAGTNATNRRVFFYSEGGTVFSGPVDVRGILRVQGNPGTAGQVLTSNGTADPEWANAAFTNTTRFKVTLRTTSSAVGYMDVISTQYNLNPTDITIGSSSITINKAGLYRLNGIFDGNANYPPAATPSWAPELRAGFELSGAMTDLIMVCNYEHYTKTNTDANAGYYLSKAFSIDMHLRAGTVIRVLKSLQYNGTPIVASGGVQFFCNLVAE